ncbi:SpoIIE family protein phosphatase [bacterium]|nr:SpoIIE family protein phosphatase [bacterium]
MQPKLTKTDGLLLVFALVGLFLFIFFYPKLFPEASLRIETPKEDIADIGTDFVEDLGYDLSRYQISVQLEYDRNQNQLHYLNQTFSPSETIRILTDSISIYYWSLRWQIEDTLFAQFGGREQEVAPMPERTPGTFQLLVDLRGKPVTFESLPERNEENRREEIAGTEETDYREAERVFNKIAQLHGGEWMFEGSQEIANPFGVIHQYRWVRTMDIANERAVFEIDVRGGRIQRFQMIFMFPDSFTQGQEENEWSTITIVVLFLILFILVVYYFIQRLRADLIDLKTGLIPGILVFIGYIFYYWVSAPPESFLMNGIVFLIATPFVGGGIWVLSVVGESLTREVWPDKLLAVDSSRRKLLSPILGVSVLRGILLACVGLGFIAILNYISIVLLNGYFVLGDSTFYLWTWAWSSFYAIGHSLLSSIYIVTTFCLFLVTLLKKKLHHSFWIFLIVFLSWSFVGFPITQLYPFILRMGIRGLIGLLFVLFFIRYDFVTVATGAIALPILFYGIVTLNSGIGIYVFHGFILVGVIVILLLFALWAYQREVSFEEVRGYVPDYLQRIYEKERIQRELEIARQVQIGFLPRSKPQIEGLDIAALCLPAKEVGGDYYDFIEMGKRKLGIVIGDVSGKGISASFYMTLVKGFLRSLARSFYSPKDIMIHMNELFYENADRGVFISMIYGVFDLDAKTLTFARAGHNPIIFRRSDKGETEEINPPGIALGLEKGFIFPKSIEEKTIQLKKNDVIFLYTDGLNEAQNPLHEEFREDRLMQIVEANSGLSAEALLHKMQWEIQNFTVDAPQHDDMTALVVKIL